MPTNPDRPFGHDTVEIRAVFVPDSATDKVSRSAISRVVGYDAVQIPAIFVPAGGKPPGHPYIAIGQPIFRPDDPGAANRQFTSGQASSQPSGDGQADDQPAPALPRTRYRFGAALSGGPAGPPPNSTVSSGRPAPVAAGLAAGLAAWRSMANPGDIWRQSLAKPTGSTVASSLSGRVDAVGDTAVPVAGRTTPAPPSGNGPARKIEGARVQATLRVIRSAENRDAGDNEAD